MKINNAANFTQIVVKLLKCLGYTDVKEVSEDGIDITASKDNEKYCFKCQYDIDAIGEKKMQSLCDAFKKGKYDKAVFVTNSSFISSAKKLGEKEGILLWDRNTVDRMAIGISESLEDEVAEPKRYAGMFIGIGAAVLLAVAAALVYFFVIR